MLFSYHTYSQVQYFHWWTEGTYGIGINLKAWDPFIVLFSTMHFAYGLLFLTMCISLWPDTHYFPAFFGHPHMIYAVSKHLIRNYSFKLNWCLRSLEKNVDPGTSIPLHLINRRDSVKEAGMLGTPWRFLWERLWRDGMGTQSLGRISTQTANSGILPTGWEVGGGRLWGWRLAKMSITLAIPLIG